jgi:hypothetical protein
MSVNAHQDQKQLKFLQVILNDSEKTIYNQQGIGYSGQEGQKQDDKQPERAGNGQFSYYFINECHISCIGI